VDVPIPEILPSIDIALFDMPGFRERIQRILWALVAHCVDLTHSAARDVRKVCLLRKPLTSAILIKGQPLGFLLVAFNGYEARDGFDGDRDAN
jgi:hypothetical protein